MREMTAYSTNDLNQAAWLVYINGIEIPAMGVTTNWGVWQMPTATIQLVPHPMLQRIGYEDRLQVAIFYLDEFWFADDPQFCLLGEFEVVGWSYMNSGHGRSLQLECVSHDQILEQLRFFYISSMGDIADERLNNATGGSFAFTKLIFPECLFMEGLTTPIDLPLEEGDATTDQGFIKRPIDFVLNVFRSLLSEVNTASADPYITTVPATVPSGFATASGKNFFARWMKMTKYHHKWCALPGLEDVKDNSCFPLLKAVQDTQTMDALKKQLGSRVGDSGSSWDLLQFIFGTMYMEVAMIPSPPAAIVEKTTGQILAGVDKPAKNQFRGILSHFVKPQCVFSLPPTCNVVFPSMVENFTFRETYITQPTRLYLSEEWLANYVQPQRNSTITDITKAILTTGYPEPIRKRLKDLMVVDNQNDKTCLLFPEEFYKGPVAARLNGPPWMYMLAQNMSANANNAFQGAVSAGTTTKTVQTGGVRGSREDPATTGTVTTVVAGTQAKAEQAAADVATSETSSLLGTIFDKYAEYEYYRSRYAERQGGMTLAWNPYILPGFPAAIFDQLNGGFHCMGYVNSLSQNCQASGTMSTTINLSFLRTMPEFLGILGDSTSFSTGIDVSPVEIIPEISQLFQVTANAQDFYTKLLYKGKKLTRSAVFDWRSMLKLKTAYGDEVDLSYEDLKKRGLTEVNNVAVIPEDKFVPLFNDYSAAMAYASRPVCTLREYIEAWHEKPMWQLLKEEVVRGEYKSFYSVMKDRSKNQMAGASFWGRIYTLIPGPGSNPGAEVLNVGPAPDYAMAADGTFKMVDRSTGTPETRQDWDQVLLAYRKIVRSEDGKIAPQR